MNESIETRLSRVSFSVLKPGADRMHYVNPEDVRVVLGRLPLELWERLRGVHFNDRSRGGRVLGYVTSEHPEIALCAQPPRMSIRLSPQVFGAQRNQKWPVLAIRRFMLYDVLLHELGHLQMIDEDRRSARLRFAREKLAQSFAVAWRRGCGRRPFRTQIRSIIRREWTRRALRTKRIDQRTGEGLFVPLLRVSVTDSGAAPS